MSLSRMEPATQQRIRDLEKTVRNHASNLLDALGAWTRAQAIVPARDRGFRSGAALPDGDARPRR
jgi:hypothetical protein